MSPDPETEIWRRCEVAWAEWLRSENWTVDLVPPYRDNDPNGAPTETLRDGRVVRRPDVRAEKGDTTEWWEVKYRTRADVNLFDGQREYWVQKDAFDDYRDLARDRNVRISVILRVEADHLHPARWLQISIPSVVRFGRRVRKVLRNGDEVDAWAWPESAMTIVPGPALSVDRTGIGPFDGVDGLVPVPDDELVVAETESRSRRGEQELGTARAARVVADPMFALDVLRRREDLAVPELPKYSVLRIAEKGEDIEPLLGLLDYGIRVFLVTPEPPESELMRKNLHFVATRLLEWSHADTSMCGAFWAVDGVVEGKRLPEWSAEVRSVLDIADDNGGINVCQYEVVHSSPDEDIVIQAGAGTGKTETMSERIMYLLSTSVLVEERGVEQYPYGLRLDDIVLVTFTREAAAQMRERLARVLNRRRRLSPRCALAAVPWLTQLASTQITTIHQYARLVTQQSASSLGFDPNLSVSSQTLELRRIMNRALSPHLTALLEEFPGNDDAAGPPIPAAHEWIAHLERVWETLGNNGIQVMPIGDEPAASVDWGVDDASEGKERRIAEVIRDTLLETGRQFAVHCIEQGLLPVDQLVPNARQGLIASPEPRIGKPRHFFVDEFQDTDGQQMDLILELSERLQSRLFVVGDVKQGIYRFRGAEGSAFNLLKTRMEKERGMSAPHTIKLVRNFRTGGTLLSSLHSCFDQWGRTPAIAGGSELLLEYGPDDALKPQVERQLDGRPFRGAKIMKPKDYLDVLVADVRTLVTAFKNDPSKEKRTIGILCRQNWTANEVRDRLRNNDLPCDVLIGGTFYQSEPVVEARVLLDAISNPSDDSALLELCETRWIGGILQSQEPPGGLEADESVWLASSGSILSWVDRLTGLGDRKNGNLVTDDLEDLRARLRSLRKLHHVMNPAALLAHCYQKFSPHTWSRVDDEVDDSRDRARYQINLEHLVVMMDSVVAERSVGLLAAIDWLRLQIATNDKEDEPQAGETGTVTALTVHKAKGQEFDHVIIPRTWDTFESSRVTTVSSVIRDDDHGAPKLLWSWRTSGDVDFENFDPASPSALREDEERRKEEARLLYVAMTRARDELVIYAESERDRETWGELLKFGGI